MDRIAKILPCKIYHGTIEWYLHRTLLWRRNDKLVRPKIYYNDRIMPSWSWMAYPGGISFIHHECNWLNMDVIKNIQFHENALETIVWRFADPDMTIKSDGDKDTQLLDLEGSTKGWTSLDTEAELLSVPDLVVVLARSNKNRRDGNRYFVLFVKQQQKSGNYERRGIGMIQEGCVLVSIGKHRIV